MRLGREGGEAGFSCGPVSFLFSESGWLLWERKGRPWEDNDVRSDALVSRKKLLAHAADYRKRAEALRKRPEKWLTGDRGERVKECLRLEGYFIKLAKGARG